MLKLVEFEEFFDKCEDLDIKPYIAQVNKSEDMFGWGVFIDSKTKDIVCTGGKPILWKSIDDLISAVFEEYGLYTDVHIYYCGGKVLDLPEHIDIKVGYGSMVREPEKMQ